MNLGDTYGTDKSLVQIPSRFAIAMTERGWLLRNEVIWHKPNVMPQPVKDRFTVDFEKFYFFSKSPEYYFKKQLEPIKADSLSRATRAYRSSKANNGPGKDGGVNLDAMGSRFVKAEGRNKRTVWTITTSGSKEAHCAMFPVALIDTPIQACLPEGGGPPGPVLWIGHHAGVLQIARHERDRHRGEPDV